MKNTLLLAAFILVAGTVSAQGFTFGPRSDYYYGANDSFQPRVGIEIGMGMSNTSLSGANTGSGFSTAALKGFNAGFIFDIPVSSQISVAPELLFSQKGYEATTTNGNFTQRTQYIDLPILAKFKVNHILSFYAGPQFSYLAALKNSYGEGFTTSAQSYYDNSSNSLFMEAVVGASLSVTHNIDLRARYNIGLQQKYSNGNQYVPTYSSHAMQFSLGYKF